MDLTASWEQLQVSMENTDMAETLLAQMRDQYSAGMVPVSELLRVQTDAARAKSDLLDRQIAYRTALAAYLDKIE